MPMAPDNMAMHAAFEAANRRKREERKAMFEKLRKQRNEAHAKAVAHLQAELGEGSILHSTFDPDSCYCNCGMEGDNPRLCEHEWNGPTVELDDGRLVTVTCSRCKTTAFSHDMRCAP
jgi:hypothetical protein